MTASVGDFVTAVLLAELAADDELSTMEAEMRARNLLQETFSARRNSKKLVMAHISSMLDTPKKEVVAMDSKKQECKGNGNNPDTDHGGHGNPAVPVPYLSYAEFHEFQTYFGIKQEVFEVCPENCIVHRSAVEKSGEARPTTDQEQPEQSADVALNAEELSKQQQEQTSDEHHNLLCLDPVREDPTFCIQDVHSVTEPESLVQNNQMVVEAV